MPKRPADPPAVEPRTFGSVEEIDRGIAKLERRVSDLETLDMAAARRDDTGADKVVRSNVCETIREVFGSNSPEFREHEHLSFFAGPTFMGMSNAEIVTAKERGRIQAIGIVRGLIDRLKEKREDLTSGADTTPTTYFDRLNLHPRILGVTRDLFLDGYLWEAVFAGAK